MYQQKTCGQNSSGIHAGFDDVVVKGIDESRLVIFALFDEIVCVLEIDSETVVVSGLGQPSAKSTPSTRTTKI